MQKNKELFTKASENLEKAIENYSLDPDVGGGYIDYVSGYHQCKMHLRDLKDFQDCFSISDLEDILETFNKNITSGAYHMSNRLNRCNNYLSEVISEKNKEEEEIKNSKAAVFTEEWDEAYSEPRLLSSTNKKGIASEIIPDELIKSILRNTKVRGPIESFHLEHQDIATSTSGRDYYRLKITYKDRTNEVVEF